MATLSIDVSQIDKLQQAIISYEGDTEKIINEIMHVKASPMLQEAVLQLMPVSGRFWKGKKGAAKISKSLTDVKENLGVTVKTTKNYQYLYFPDDGTNTRHHVGNQQFFMRGGEMKEDEIVNLCVDGLVRGFEKAID